MDYLDRWHLNLRVGIVRTMGKLRALYVLISLTLIVAPLFASLCGDCVSGHCMEIIASRVSPPNTPQVESHCQKSTTTEEAPSDEAPCHSEEAASMASNDCCSMAEGSELGEDSGLAGSIVFEFGLEAAAPFTALSGDRDRGFVESRYRLASRQAPPPLYTLHSAFLI